MSDRWLSLLELVGVLAKDRPDIANLPRRRQRRRVLRLVRRVEKVQGQKISRRVGREIFVSRNGADALRKWDPESLGELTRTVSDLHAKQRDHERRLNGHGSKLREQGAKIREIEEKQRLADDYLSGMARLDRRATGT